jgi:hypothetical protein
MGCGDSRPNFPDIDLNFNEPEALSENERQLVDEAMSHISKTPKLLELIKNYEGCEGVIREALSNPGKTEIEKNAFRRVSEIVDILYKFYSFSLKLEAIWPNLLHSICTDNSEDSISNSQATVKQIAELFRFVFMFDNEKIMHPSIQNDFAYYRRVHHKMKQHAKKRKKKKVDEEIANKISLFFAYPTPLMKVLIDSTTKIKENPNLVTGLSMLADSCTKALIEIKENNEGLREDIENGHDFNAMLFLCTLAGCIILVDHLDQNGVFHGKSPVEIKVAVETLVDYSNNYITNTFLLNSLRFTTLHLNDEQTIAAVKRLLNPQ